MKPKKVPGVPPQVKGHFHDTESLQKFENSQLADQKFEILKENFFAIGNWNANFQKKTVEFTHCNFSGETVNRVPQIGDYIKILLSKKSSPKQEDYQWVQIDMIDKSNPQRIMMQCRPSKLPGNNFGGSTIHFHSATSTMTFIVSKRENQIKMAVYGRNLKANKNTGFVTSLKNTFTGLGEKFGAQKIHWKTLTDGLVNVK